MTVFSFSPLNITIQCLLASMRIDEKSAHNLIEDLLCVMSHFLLGAFKILSLPLSLDNLIITFLGVGLIQFTLHVAP